MKRKSALLAPVMARPVVRLSPDIASQRCQSVIVRKKSRMPCDPFAENRARVGVHVDRAVASQSHGDRRVHIRLPRDGRGHGVRALLADARQERLDRQRRRAG